jgi:hypothetical protein
VSDLIALAQEQLGKTLDRARAEEDRELAFRVRELGAQSAHLLNGLFHMARTHALNNVAFDVPLRDFGIALRQLLDILGPVSLQCVEDQVYVNDLRIRFEKLIEKSITLGEDLRRHNTGGLTFNAPLEDGEIRTLIRVFSAPPDPTDPRGALQSELISAGTSSIQVHPPFRYRVTGEEHESAAREFCEVYQASATTVASVFASLGSDRLPSPLPVRRLVQQIIDAAKTGDAVDLAKETEETLPPFARHTLMVTNLALLIGRAAGLSDASLADLGVSAVFHDVGFCMSEDGFTVPFERHTRAGLRVLLRQRGFHRAKLRRLLAVMQHHYDLHDGRGSPVLHARIVHIADDYDTLTRYRPAQGPVLSTPDCLARMAAQAGKAYDPLLLQLFCNIMGRFPPGAILTLADGRVVLSVSTVRTPETFDKPLCKVIRNPDGSTPDGKEFLDLAQGGRVVKILHPRA